MTRAALYTALLLLTAPMIKAQNPPALAPLPLPSPETRAGASGMQTSGPKQPVFLYLYASVSDQVNLDITVDRLHRLLPMVEHLRAAHPEAHVVATILFSGAASRALDESNAKTHIKDLVLDYKKRGIIEVGYDGADEPTYSNRSLVPTPVDESTPQDRFAARVKASEEFLTEARDPLTGAPKPGMPGGLAEMQRVFGEASCIANATPGQVTKYVETKNITGVGATPHVMPEVGNWEVIRVVQKYNSKALMFGIPSTNPAQIPGFRTSLQEIGRLMTPIANASPELYWTDNELQLSESGGGLSILHGYDTVDSLKDFLSKMDRSHIRIVHMEIGSQNDYLKPDFVKAATLSPTLSYAYAHPDNPKVPAEDRLSAADVDAVFANEKAALTWMASEFFSANAGSRFVSSTDLEHMVSSPAGFSISMASLSAAVSEMVREWGNTTYPPIDLAVDGRYLSLAETFQVLTDALAEFDRTGKLPQTVRVTKVHGPYTMQQGHGPNVGEVSVADIAKECSALKAQLHDEAGYPMQHNAVPPGLTIDGIVVTTTQFLRLMAEAIVNPDPNAKVRVRMAYMTPGTAMVFPKTRVIFDTGATWTFKPAPLNVKQ